MANDVQQDSFPLDEYFRPGVLPEDLPGVFSLFQARDPLAAFGALFRGSDDDVLVRILVLREIGARGENPHWTTRELEQYFSYLDPTKLNTVLLRLKKHNLLIYDGETALHHISPAGRMVLAALETLFKFAGEEGGELGYLTSQVSAGKSLGRISPATLQHLLSRLRELEEEFTQAIVSGSEHRIHKAEKKLQSVWIWVSKGTEVIGELTSAELDSDPLVYKVAQRIAQVQSRMLHMTSSFQRTLNQIERQKVHLGASGLSSSDINAWLRDHTKESLAALAADAVAFIPHPGFLLSDIAVDIAEHILIERTRDEMEVVELPPPNEAPQVEEILSEPEDLSRLFALQEDLENLEGDTSLQEFVPAVDFLTSSYRLTLVSLLNDAEKIGSDGPVAELAQQPFTVELGNDAVQVHKHGVHSMTAGHLRRKVG